MTQKDNVKQLIGKSLNAYNNKVLQQIDRIEKKNEQQNHKISMLTNELDNDYLTKSEEGSVISLDHSKEGMVYIDSLEGNTLVNYCTDGAKELTLNGDIDLEGTFVTTTEGVDNGKVDVMCEGNTLVNIANHPNAFTVTRIEGQTYQQYDVPLLHPLKPETTYTIYLTIDKNEFDHDPFTSIVIGQGNTDNWSCRVFWNKEFGKTNTDKGLGRHKAIFTTHSRIGESNFKFIKFIFETYPEYNTTIKDIILLEEEHSEDIDNFIGMKSVGQDDINGHKIEILSSIGKPNLIKNSGFLNGISNYSFHNNSQGEVMNDTSSQSGKILKITTGSNGGLSGPFQSNIVNYIEDKKYTLSGWCKGEPGTTLGVYIERHKSINVTFTNDDWVRFVVTSEQNPTNWNRTITFYSSNISKVFYLKDIKIEESDNDTPYIPHISEKNYNSFNGINKKEILLNEPLRGLPNGVKDRFVKLGGKWYIERNCVGYTPDTSTATFRKNYDVTSIIDFKIDNIKNHNQSAQSFHMECLSTIPYGDPSGTKWQNETHWLKYYPMTKNTISTEGQRDKGSVSIFYNKEWTDQQIIDWCNNNNLKFILPCEIPTYEEITDVELMTYLDTTHISNNSLIPCNMKVKNSGYNAIIKPSTLYTIALDTNKSGTIGMNLSGAKVTTTNNVATITTPVTLSDDSLRIYGKGIKGSKVRILEGDKTNWIPSHFEGMKSSFEDKFDTTDNTYKMKILSNNKNLFSSNDIKTLDTASTHKIQVVPTGYIITSKYTHQGWAYSTIDISKLFKPNTTYKLSCKITKSNNDTKPAIRIYRFLDNKDYGIRYNSGEFTFTTPSCGVEYLRLLLYSSIDNVISNENDFVKFEDIQISEVKSDFIMKECNKIQFSSIEPLRGVDDVKDKFVFKDGKLMIERNCDEFIVDGINIISSTMNGRDGTTTKYGQISAPNRGKIVSNTLPNRSSWSSDIEGIETNGDAIGVRIHKSKLDLSLSNPINDYLKRNNLKICRTLITPTYEEIPFELQKIILEGYENGTLFFDTNIPPTSTITYAGETPIVKSVKLNKTEVLNNTTDINDNIIPYLMDMDYRVVCLELATETQGISMARLFGGVYEMLKRDILSGRLSKEEYGYRLADYFNAGKLTEEQVRELEDLK